MLIKEAVLFLRAGKEKNAHQKVLKKVLLGDVEDLNQIGVEKIIIFGKAESLPSMLVLEHLLNTKYGEGLFLRGIIIPAFGVMTDNRKDIK